MIASIDKKLETWLQATLPDVSVRFGTPLQASEAPCVNLCLMEIANERAQVVGGHSEFEVSLVYLVTAHSIDTRATNDLLGSVLTAALDEPTIEVQHGGVDTSAWLALQVPAQPAFTIRQHVTRSHKQPVARVTKAVQAKVLPLTQLAGRIVGPGDIPIPQARVEVPGTRHVAYSDSRGGFSFGVLSSENSARELRIVARGLEQRVSIASQSGKPLLIRFQPLEK